MKILVMHVGMHKTGTTSIQVTFDRHRALLLEHGINYMSTTEPNHSQTIHSLFASTPHTFHYNVQQGVDSPGKAAAHNEALRAHIESQCRRNDSPLFVVCGEAISGLPLEAVRHLEALFAPYFDCTRVVGYVRPPRSYMNSSAVQWLKRGMPMSEIRRSLPVPNYRYRFEKFDRVFGADNLTLKLFAPTEFVNGCVVASFLSDLGAPPHVYEKLSVTRVNETISLTAAKLLSAANQQVPSVRNSGHTPERAERLVRQLSRISGPRFALPEKAVSKAIASMRDDITWMERRLGLSLQPYDRPAEGPPSFDSYAHLDEAELGSIVETVNQLLKR